MAPLNESVLGRFAVFLLDVAILLVVVLPSHQNDSGLHRTLFLMFVGQGLCIKDTVPISDDEGDVFLKLADV